MELMSKTWGFSRRILKRRLTLGNADASTRGLSDLGDLASSPANDTSNHIRRNADVLGLQLLSILIMSRRTIAPLSSIGIRSAVVVGSRRATFAEISPIASSSDTTAVVVVLASTVSAIAWSCALGSLATGLSSDDWVVQNSAGSSLPIINQAFANFPNSLLNSFWATLNLDNALGGLRKHLLLRNHANAGCILDVLDLETLTTNDRAHLVVRDQQLDCCNYH